MAGDNPGRPNEGPVVDEDGVEQPKRMAHDREVSGLNPLTPRETMFVHEFAKDVNAVEAAKRAGYKYGDPNDAYKLLERPNIQHAVMILMNARERTVDLTTQRVIEEMAAIAFANIGDFVDWNAGAVMVRGKNMIESEKLSAIAEITEVTLPNGMTTIRFKLHNKLKALEDLLAYTTKKDEAVDGEASGLAEELTKRRQRALARAQMEAALEAEDAEEAHRVVRESPPDPDRDVLDEALDSEEQDEMREDGVGSGEAGDGSHS